MEDGGAQGEAAAGEEEEGVLGPAPRGCESPWYLIACVNVFSLFPEEFNSDPCCLYSVLRQEGKGRGASEEVGPWEGAKPKPKS